MKLAIISDVHNKYHNLQIPECDVLISCGDYSFHGEKHIVKDFHSWLDQQPANYIISVQGNHETWVQKNFNEAKELAESVCPGVHFIEHGAIEIEGVKFFGSAWTPWFNNWAWNAHRGSEIAYYWSQIPEDTEVLITHGPPHGILDVVYAVDGVTPKGRAGCYDLMDRINALPNLKMHCFGHIHSGSGEQEFNGIKFINASICDEMYTPTNQVRIFEL